MTPRAFLALPLALGACSNPKAASEANFEAAIQDHLAGRRACLDVPAGFPLELLEGSFDFRRRAELLDELVAVGLLAAEPVRKEVPGGWYGTDPNRKRATRTIDGKLYSVSESGRAALGRELGRLTYFCYGGYRVREVTNFTDPAQADGQTVSTASYTYSAEGIAGWARDSELLRESFPRLARDLGSEAEPIKGRAVLVLTQNGWIYAAMFGK